MVSFEKSGSRLKIDKRRLSYVVLYEYAIMNLDIRTQMPKINSVYLDQTVLGAVLIEFALSDDIQTKYLNISPTGI